MKKCLNCGKEIEQAVGKRERLYCDSKCRAASFQKKSSGKRKYVRIETFEAMKKELEELRFKVTKGNAVQIKAGLDSEIKYTEVTPESFSGKKLDKHYLGDEYGQMPTPKDNSIKDKIAADEAELAGLGVGAFANQRRKFLTDRIKELKKQLQ